MYETDTDFDVYDMNIHFIINIYYRYRRTVIDSCGWEQGACVRVCRRERGPRATGGSLRAGARGRGAARATLFIKERSYAAVATVAAPATGKLPALVIYLRNL